MDSEYPTMMEYLNILDNEYKTALLYKEFRNNNHVYSKKYLYGFNMDDNSCMLWSEISPKTIMNDISRFLDSTMRYYFTNPSTDKGELEKLIKLTNRMSSDNKLRGIYNRYEAEIIDDTFMEKLNRTLPHHLPISKCRKIDLRTGEVTPLTKKDYFTFACPVRYTRKRSPELMKMLNDIACHKADDLAYIQKMLGYGLTGHIDSRVYFILFGKGCNGKTVLLNLMSKILCDQYQSVSKCVFINSNTGKTGGSEVLQLKNCRMATFSETNANDELNEAIIKMISGNDPITARGLYKDPMTFVPMCKLILCTNFKPDFNANDKANVDRVRLVPLNARFVEKPSKANEYQRINGIDKLIETNYLDEFFSWCVDGAIEYYKSPEFTPVGEMLDAQNEYIQEQSNISNFIDDMFDVSDDTNVVLKTEIKNSYDVWCKESSVKPMKMGVLYSAFDDRFGKSVKSGAKDTKNKWVYKGLKYKNDEVNADDDLDV